MVLKKITPEIVKEAGKNSEILWVNLLDLIQSKSLDGERLSEFMSSLPMGLRLVFYVTKFTGDLVDGGIRKFIEYSLPTEIEETLNALDTVGAKRSAQVIRRAVEIYLKTPELAPYYGYGRPDPETVDNTTDEVEAQLDVLDDGRGDEMEDMVLLERFIRDHPEQFLYDPNS